MKKISINGRIMEEKLKYGWTLPGLAQHYKVTEEEFIAILHKNFSKKAVNGMLSRLKKNEKKGNTKIAIAETPISSDTISEDTVETTTEITVDDLKNQKTFLEEFLNSQEIEHQNLVKTRNSIRNSVSTYQKQLLRLQKDVLACKSALEEAMSNYDDTLSKMQTLNSEISKTRESIANIDNEIKALSKICIYVYESGELSVESAYDIDVSDWKTCYEKLLHNEELENLTIKQIKTLAQCLAYVEYFTEKNISYEFIFESEILEECFKKNLKI